MSHWIGYTHQGRAGFGRLDGQRIEVHAGDLFASPAPTGAWLELEAVQIDLPCRPGKFIGLWNNYHAQAAKQGLAIPAEPLYFLKPPSSFRAHGQPIEVPEGFDGRVVYEGELGLVIGRTCRNASLEQAAAAIFGVTCVNDVTAPEYLTRDSSFAQWTRAKGMDTFGVFGPVIATAVDLGALSVRTLVNGRERQNHACVDMIFSPAQVVSMISKDMTLQTGDLIACGTSVGALPMKPGTVVEVAIDGVGVLRNVFMPNAAAA